MVPNLCRRKKSFKSYSNKHVSVKWARETQQQQQHAIQLTVEFQWKSPFTFTILGDLTETFSTEMKPCQFPAKGKRRGRKGKMREGEEAKDEEAVSLFAFCACKNVGSCDCAWRTKASVVLDWLTTFRVVLVLFVRWWPEKGSTSF